MGAFTTIAERIVRQPALTMPGNATGSEAACTALTGSQIRAICGLGTTDNVTHNILTATTSVLTPLLSTASGPLTLSSTSGMIGIGGTTSSFPALKRNANELLCRLGDDSAAATFKAKELHTSSGYITTFAGAYAALGSLNTGYPTIIFGNGSGVALRVMDGAGTYTVDIKPVGSNSIGGVFTGQGTSNPASGALATWQCAAVDNPGAALTLGNSTYGVTVPGAATFSGDISMSKTSAQGYIRAWSDNGVCNISIRGVASNQGYIETNIGSIIAIPYSGLFGITAGDGASTPKSRTYDTATTKWIEKYHDGTNGILSTSSGALVLSPATSIIGIGGITSSHVALRHDSSTNTLQVKLGDNSAFAPLTALTGHFGSGNIYSANKPIFIEATGSDTGANYAGMEIRATASSQHGPTIYLNGSAQTGGKHWAIGVTGGLDGGTVGTFVLASDISYGTVLSISPSRVMTLDGSFACAGITASGAIQETYRTSSLDPTTSDIGSGKRQGWYNTSSLEFRDWVNVGGTLYKSAVYT